MNRESLMPEDIKGYDYQSEAHAADAADEEANERAVARWTRQAVGDSVQRLEKQRLKDADPFVVHSTYLLSVLNGDALSLHQSLRFAKDTMQAAQVGALQDLLAANLELQESVRARVRA